MAALEATPIGRAVTRYGNVALPKEAHAVLVLDRTGPSGAGQ